jgi:hypothetical protein
MLGTNLIQLGDLIYSCQCCLLLSRLAASGHGIPERVNNKQAWLKIIDIPLEAVKLLAKKPHVPLRYPLKGFDMEVVHPPVTSEIDASLLERMKTILIVHIEDVPLSCLIAPEKWVTTGHVNGKLEGEG